MSEETVHMEFLRTVAQWPELRGENTQTSGEEADIDEDDSDGEDYEDGEDSDVSDSEFQVNFEIAASILLITA